VNRTSTLIFALVGISIFLSWFMTRRGELGPSAGGQCLGHADCRPNERCVVVPKGDGFASFGQCGEACSDDATCPNGWRCFDWVDEQKILSPEHGQAAELKRVRACAHHAVLGKKE